MHEVLQDIIRKKRVDLEIAKASRPLSVLTQQARGVDRISNFLQAVQPVDGTALIAEIKLASPTHSQLGDRAAILDRAREYEHSGADAISFITEPHYFGGRLDDIIRLKQATSLPVLQKDFVIDAYQIYEARTAGSDALLIIAKLLEADELRQFTDLAQRLGVEPVVEVNDQTDLVKALEAPVRVIAVNARNLSTFKVDVPGACQLLKSIPDKYVRLGFSGVISGKQVAAYANAGARGVLVGTSLMQSEDVSRDIIALKGGQSHDKS